MATRCDSISVRHCGESEKQAIVMVSGRSTLLFLLLRLVSGGWLRLYRVCHICQRVVQDWARMGVPFSPKAS